MCERNLEFMLLINFQVTHPIHDQTLFLTESQKKQLKEEFGKILVWILSSLLWRKVWYMFYFLCRYRAMDICATPGWSCFYPCRLSSPSEEYTGKQPVKTFLSIVSDISCLWIMTVICIYFHSSGSALLAHFENVYLKLKLFTVMHKGGTWFCCSWKLGGVP